MTDSAEQTVLDAGVAQLSLLLAPLGFTYEPTAEGSSSGGPFAAGAFRRQALEIGLVVRHTDQLGCPNYSAGHGHAGHDDLLQALGCAADAHLVAGDWPSYVSVDGGDPFDALAADLRDLILPALAHGEAAFLDALMRAHQQFMRRLSGKSG